MKNEVKIVENKIIITYNGSHIIRPLDHIRFCESCCHCCEIYFDPLKPFVAPIGINKLEMMLPEDSFYMIQRKYIVYFGILEEAKIEEHKIIYYEHNLTISRDKIAEFLYKSETFRFHGSA